MNRVLKYAWYQFIATLGATLIAAAIIALAAIFWRGKEFSAIILFGAFIFVHFFRVFFPLKEGEIPFDERDTAIKQRATTLTFTLFWYLFAAACLIPVVVIGNGTIHVSYLGCMIVVAAIFFRITWAIIVIVQYGRVEKEVEGSLA